VASGQRNIPTHQIKETKVGVASSGIRIEYDGYFQFPDGGLGSASLGVEGTEVKVGQKTFGIGNDLVLQRPQCPSGGAGRPSFFRAADRSGSRVSARR
jgi:hypothetical protein